MKRWFLPLVAAWIILHILLFIILPHFIPYLGFFPYKDTATSYHLPSFITSLANFDGEHYLLIANSGYNQYEQAFFPLYPLLIHFVGALFGKNYLFSAILISSVSFFIGLFFFKNYLQEIVTDRKDHLPVLRWSQLLLLCFPTAFFFTTVYTEGLFFFLIMASLYSMKKKLYFIAALLAFLSALTRLVGVFIFIPILFSLVQEYWMNKKKYGSILKFMQAQLRPLLVLVAPFLGLITYCFYLWKTTGDPLFFLHAQSAFGANRSSNLILFPQVIYRYFKIFLNSQHNFQYFVSVVELSFFLFVLIVLCLELIQLIQQKKSAHFLDRLSLNIFSFINLLLPTFTGTFSSIPRYVLMSFSVFIFLGTMRNTAFKVVLLLIFSVLHILLFGFFIQGYFIS